MDQAHSSRPGGSGTPAELLAAEPLMARALPAFDTASAPANPAALFLDWLTTARRSGVLDAHAVTLSTAGADAVPDARIVGLRDLDLPGGGWGFAADAASPKGVQLAERPVAAMSVYWPGQGRQIRIRGPVERAPAGAAAADFRARPSASRTAGLVGRQSLPLGSAAEYDAAAARARLLLDADPEATAPGHGLYTLRAVEVEFWQGAADRRHVRLRFTRTLPGADWSRRLLWP